MSKLFIPAIMTASIALAACTTVVENIPGVYTIDIQQGNIINQEIVDQLRPDMNKRQVLYIMGSPMLRDVFHQKRWEYIFSEQPGGEERLQKRLSLYFEDDKLVGVQGDFRPSNVLVLKPSHEVTIELPERELEKTMSDKVVDLFTFSEQKPPVVVDEIDEAITNTAGDTGPELNNEAETTPMDTSESDSQESMETDDVKANEPTDSEPLEQRLTPATEASSDNNSPTETAEPAAVTATE
jgi:outer membrane protein assembly factor BamE